MIERKIDCIERDVHCERSRQRRTEMGGTGEMTSLRGG